MLRFRPQVPTIAIVALVGSLASVAQAADVGDTTDALPGIARVPTATAPDGTGFAFAGAAGYGYTESVLNQGDSHNRAQGSFAASFQPTPLFAAALILDGHYDSNSGAGASSGGVGYSRIEARINAPLGGGLRLGAQLGVWFPGGSAPSFVLNSTTPDISGLATYHATDSRFTLTARAGFRWDNSANAITDPDRLPLAGKVTLGYNQASAVLLALGTAVRLTPRTELLVDATWDLLVGTGAPSAGQSPILVDLGARYALDQAGALQISLVGTVSPSGRPVVTTTSPLVDIEPRVGAYVAFTLRPGRLGYVEPVAPPPPPPSPPPPPPLPPPPPTVVHGKLIGHVATEDGKPIASAHIAVRPGTPRARTVETDEHGRFEMDDVDVGEASVEITADGYASITRAVTVSESTPELQVPMAKALPSGQVRGLIRDFSGKPVAATIRIEPLGVEVHVDPDGKFTANVAPGTYQVVIHAAGYSEQKRRVVVERDGVTVLNAELRTGR